MKKEPRMNTNTHELDTEHAMSFMDKLLDGAEVEWKTLGEVCGFKNGFAFKVPDRGSVNPTPLGG